MQQAALSFPSHTLEHFGQLSAESVRAYVLAGKSILTLRSAKTGTRFTYKITLGKDSTLPFGPWFVGLLSGPNNVDDYTYLGIFTSNGRLKLSRKSAYGKEAPAYKALLWALPKLLAGRIPMDLEVYHNGTCGRCGRELTVPESVRTGLGPACRKKAE